MADISMCRGEGCPLKESCYRHKAKKSEYWQTYFVEVPYENGECKYYWKLEPLKTKQNESTGT